VQFFWTNLKLKQDHYYRVSVWLRTDGMEGPLRCFVRKIGYPWTTYLGGWKGDPTKEWRQYSFTGKCASDVDSDVGVCFETAYMGKFWIDDITVEEDTEPFPSAPAPVRDETGNLLPRSSAEAVRDYLWCGGIYAGPQGEWEDPQPARAEGGKFGRYCLAVPAAISEGRSFCRSAPIPITPGEQYTYSAWLKANKTPASASLAAFYFGTQKGVGSKGFGLTQEWQRCAVALTPDATSPTNQIILDVGAVTPGTTVYADGLQLERGAAATDYGPRYPLELSADTGQAGGNLWRWGQKIPLCVGVHAADQTALASVPVNVKIIGYPDVTVWQKTLPLKPGQPQTLNLDLKRHGLMRVELRTTDPKLAAPQELLIAVVPPPRPTGTESLFGTHITVRPFFIRYAHGIGIKWTRFHDASLITKWGGVEPERGTRRWFDAPVDALRQGGLNILALPDYPPKWAKTEGELPYDLAAFAAHCQAVAAHYRGRITTWELWNEPYMEYFFKGDLKQYSVFAAAAQRALRQGNPDAVLIGCCSPLEQPKWAEGIDPAVRQGLDAWSFHFYTSGLTGGGTMPFAGELADLRQLLSDTKIQEYWNSEGTNWEVGDNCFYTFMPSTPEINERAVAYASRVWMEHAKAGISKFFQYHLHQTDTAIYFGSGKLFIGYDRSPTPAAVATAVTAWAMDGLKNVPTAPLEGTVQALFTGPDRRCWAIYDDGGTPGRRQLSLGKLPADAQVMDAMGNDPRADGKKVWPIGISPLFVVSTKLSAEALAAGCVRAVGE
ncbi:MAG: endo-1,4-beta-xylanase, partial [Armatimonadetes bacterium]|nr:endo-1,4-beta-xylanase [Armatimonadota bacterium]